MSDKHHRYYKHTKFHQNPRGDPKFLVDLTWNDPYAIFVSLPLFLCYISRIAPTAVLYLVHIYHFHTSLQREEKVYKWYNGTAISTQECINEKWRLYIQVISLLGVI